MSAEFITPNGVENDHAPIVPVVTSRVYVPVTAPLPIPLQNALIHVAAPVNSRFSIVSALADEARHTVSRKADSAMWINLLRLVIHPPDSGRWADGRE